MGIVERFRDQIGSEPPKPVPRIVPGLLPFLDRAPLPMATLERSQDIRVASLFEDRELSDDIVEFPEETRRFWQIGFDLADPGPMREGGGSPLAAAARPAIAGPPPVRRPRPRVAPPASSPGDRSVSGCTDEPENAGPPRLAPEPTPRLLLPRSPAGRRSSSTGYGISTHLSDRSHESPRRRSADHRRSGSAEPRNSARTATPTPSGARLCVAAHSARTPRERTCRRRGRRRWRSTTG